MLFLPKVLAMRILVFFVLFGMATAQANCIWGKTGHRVTGHIAEKHLTKKARKAISKLLDGHSLAFASTYADEIKSDRKYSSFTPWHYVNYPLDMQYKDAKKSSLGDLVTAIEKCKQVLSDAKSTRADKVFYLNFLIHIIGDLHQPLHTGREVDRGGNDIQVQWFGQGSNLHTVWDSKIIESYKMTYYELADELDRSTTKKEKKKIQQGSVIDWLEESHVLAKEIYGSVEVGEGLGYRYTYKYNPVVFKRLKEGGFRLAKVLNDIFS